ncbi:hypothetical protein P153DRAFT_361373 [Dothidotthia symphoricarpi CBS 119687]|uniref:Uncharacterized protein n=1 Tax=Dothidotthia symphoricarpi CBS 119687 TaxID=1392245 RepID=A0A6A6A0H6_9PLEO|nr:uncharacterized protein P153DRAFT_361373 [Dothidotthia symphoricarpi CBS 119687]KAF2124198.1 hypothetical protein P153DRAFT_361373 [Dothidotthia symphoricarpi CBS 119687]
MYSNVTVKDTHRRVVHGKRQKPLRSDEKRLPTCDMASVRRKHAQCCFRDAVQRQTSIRRVSTSRFLEVETPASTVNLLVPRRGILFILIILYAYLLVYKLCKKLLNILIIIRRKELRTIIYIISKYRYKYIYKLRRKLIATISVID